MEYCVFTEPQQGATYDELLRCAQATERLGFTGFFRSDHYLTMGGDGLPGPSDAWTSLAGLARETERVRLGTLVSSVMFRHPGVLAIQVAQVDEMSGGRVELGIGTGGYSVWGSSAGARMAANIGSHGPGGFGGDALPKPSAVVMAYTGHARLASDEPPTFVVVGAQDGIAPPATMQRRAAALRRQGTRVEFREYEGVGHGFGVGTGTSAEGWVAEAVRFWAQVDQQRR